VNIENAIKQKSPFRNEYQKLTVNLMFTNSWLKEHLSLFFNEFGITVKQYNILRILKGAGKPVSSSFIRERMLDKMSDTSRIIDRMCKKGIIHKESCQNDKRLIDISLNSEGNLLLEEIDLHINKIDNIFTNLSEEEAKLLNALLDKSRLNYSFKIKKFKIDNEDN
jgi:DNA-binding MarR family transcriptional regulator